MGVQGGRPQSTRDEVIGWAILVGIVAVLFVCLANAIMGMQRLMEAGQP